MTTAAGDLPVISQDQPDEGASLYVRPSYDTSTQVAQTSTPPEQSLAELAEHRRRTGV